MPIVTVKPRRFREITSYRLPSHSKTQMQPTTSTAKTKPMFEPYCFIKVTATMSAMKGRILVLASGTFAHLWGPEDISMGARQHLDVVSNPCNPRCRCDHSSGRHHRQRLWLGPKSFLDSRGSYPARFSRTLMEIVQWPALIEHSMLACLRVKSME